MILTGTTATHNQGTCGLHHIEIIERQRRQPAHLGELLSSTGAVAIGTGPADIPKLVYLTMFTAVLDRPVSLVIKGSTSAGKSFSLDAGRQFIPDYAYEQFEGMSEKALVYLKDLDLRHKHLIISEASGMADGDGRTLLRQLLSEGRVRYATVQSTSANGLEGAELPVLEGPCGLIMTTTATGLHPEDESRMLSATMRESPEQIGLALIKQASKAGKTQGPIDMEPWFALYEYVKSGPRTVVIPFAERLAGLLPRTHNRIQRDFRQVLSLIEACSLMHSCQRGADDSGAVIAQLDDYSMVRDLVNEPISQGLALAVPDGIKMVVHGVAELIALTKVTYTTVSQTQLAEHLQRDQGVVSRNVVKAIRDGYLVNRNPGQGREAQLAIGELKLPTGLALPEPSELVEPAGAYKCSFSPSYGSC